MLTWLAEAVSEQEVIGCPVPLQHQYPVPPEVSSRVGPALVCVVSAGQAAPLREGPLPGDAGEWRWVGVVRYGRG